MCLTKEDILIAINNSGYLFEQEIASILENNKFYIQTNVAFNDEDEEKSREIDVVGYRRFFHDEERKISIGVRVLCECKNNTNPFVFICRNKNEVDKQYSPPNFIFPKKEYQKPIVGKTNSYYIYTGFQFFDLAKIHPYSQKNTKAVQFCKIIRKGKEWCAFHDGIYDSILLPMIKCIEFYRKQDNFNNSEWQYYTILFPIIVLNSDLYSIDSHISPNDVNEVEFIHFTRDINYKKIKNNYLIDFVTKKGLTKYIEENINAFVDEFKKAIVC